MKKERFDYFEHFIKNSEYSLECSKILSDFISNFKLEYIEVNRAKIHEVENKADGSKHEMLNFLLKDFLPPIEREDIILLANRIDDVTDEIDDILIKMEMYNVKKIRKEAVDCTKLLVKCCEKLEDLLAEFKGFKKAEKVIEKVVEINNLEEEGDKLYIEIVKDLYAKSNDATELIVWTKIFECFESCYDACELVANAVEEIVLKNS